MSSEKVSSHDGNDDNVGTTVYVRRLAWSEGWQPPGAQSAFIK